MVGIIGFEESQEVTMAFRRAGHEFYSNDLKECSGGHPEWHYNEDFFNIIQKKLTSIDFLGVHPVCRYNANSGVRWLTSKTKKPGYEWSDEHKIFINKDRWEKMVIASNVVKSALSYVRSVGLGYVEQPVLHKYALDIIGERPSQVIQPWMFGDTTKKATCLWIIGLPNLVPTNIIPMHLRTDEIHKCSPGPMREQIRSKTFPGIARAMADQWG